MRIILAVCVLAATFVVPALAQETQKKGSDADEAFMTGIRKIGVMTGQAYACSKEAEQPQIGQGAIDLATQVALHFGLQAAFVYSGSFGYGIGHEFDHAICPQAIADFKALQAKYLGRSNCTPDPHCWLRLPWCSQSTLWRRRSRHSCPGPSREPSTPLASLTNPG